MRLRRGVTDAVGACVSDLMDVSCHTRPEDGTPGSCFHGGHPLVCRVKGLEDARSKIRRDHHSVVIKNNTIQFVECMAVLPIGFDSRVESMVFLEAAVNATQKHLHIRVRGSVLCDDIPRQ